MIVATTYTQLDSHNVQKSRIAYTFIVKVSTDEATMPMWMAVNFESRHDKYLSHVSKHFSVQFQESTVT